MFVPIVFYSFRKKQFYCLQRQLDGQRGVKFFGELMGVMGMLVIVMRSVDKLWLKLNRYYKRACGTGLLIEPNRSHQLHWLQFMRQTEKADNILKGCGHKIMMTHQIDVISGKKAKKPFN